MSDISIVTTLYRSEAFIEEFYVRATAAAVTLGGKYEIVFVNDGSPDGSLAAVVEIAKADHRVRVVDLSRNFGHHIAAFAAIEAAKGDRIFLIDSDLEECPEWLGKFTKVMDEQVCDVVYGVQSENGGRLSGIFYRVFNAVSDTRIPAHACTARLMSRSYVDALLQMHDRRLFMAGMFMWAGFRQVGFPVIKCKRRSGTSTYTLMRQFTLFADAITSFSSKPLYGAFFTGGALALTAVLIGLVMIVRKLLFPETVLAGFTTLMASIMFVGGLNILFLGVIGIYLGKIYGEVKDRPLYLTRPTEIPRARRQEAKHERSTAA